MPHRLVGVGGARRVAPRLPAVACPLNQDPDILDPTLARTYVGRIVFASICEKLYEIDENLSISRSSPPSCRGSPTAARR